MNFPFGNRCKQFSVVDCRVHDSGKGRYGARALGALRVGGQHQDAVGNKVDGVEALDDRLRVAQYLRKFVGHTSEDAVLDVRA